MDDLISRQAAIDILMKEWKAYKDYPYVSHVRNGLEIAIAMLENKVPSAQQERKMGKWILINGAAGLYECDQCHERVCCVGKYCMNCGAIMEEQE